MRKFQDGPTGRLQELDERDAHYDDNARLMRERAAERARKAGIAHGHNNRIEKPYDDENRENDDS